MQILHTMLRVGDLERAIRFYTGVLGMRAYGMRLTTSTVKSSDAGASPR